MRIRNKGLLLRLLFIQKGMKLCKFSNTVDKADFEGFEGYTHRVSSVLVFPSNLVTREKWLTSKRTCGLMVVENNEVSSSPLSQSSLSIFPPSYGLAHSTLFSFDPALPSSVFLS